MARRVKPRAPGEMLDAELEAAELSDLVADDGAPESARAQAAQELHDPVPLQKARKERKDKGRTHKKREHGPAHERRAPEGEITLEATIAMLTVLAGTLSTFVDESFSPFVDETMTLDPRIRQGAESMLPWLEKYGGSMALIAPWIGLLSGAAIIVGPGVPATFEIVAGLREPLIFRSAPPAAARTVNVTPIRAQEPAP